MITKERGDWILGQLDLLDELAAKNERREKLRPVYRLLLEQQLSVQERAVTVRLVGELEGKSWGFELKDVVDKVRIKQHSHLSAILTRLVKKGILTRVGRGWYKFLDKDLVEHIKVQCLRIL